jgi:hypothetical protein
LRSDVPIWAPKHHIISHYSSDALTHLCTAFGPICTTERKFAQPVAVRGGLKPAKFKNFKFEFKKLKNQVKIPKNTLWCV